MDETSKLIEEQKKNLPPELVKAIESTAWEPLAQKIGQENGLNAVQTEALEQEVMFVIYGFENPANLSSNIAREVGVDERVSSNISDAIWEKIMNPISAKATSSSTTQSTAKTRPHDGDTIVITPKTKEDAIKELTRRREELTGGQRVSAKTLPVTPPANSPQVKQNLATALEIAPEIHPVSQQAGYGTSPMPLESSTPKQVSEIKLNGTSRGINHVGEAFKPTPTPSSTPAPVSEPAKQPEFPPIQRPRPVEPKPQPVPQAPAPAPTPAQPVQPAQPVTSPTASSPKKDVSLPDYRYPAGTDPYREPLQ